MKVKLPAWLEDIEKEVRKAEAAYPSGMPAHNKATLRAKLRREAEWFGRRSERDYSPADVGEAPKGSNW